MGCCQSPKTLCIPLIIYASYCICNSLMNICKKTSSDTGSRTRVCSVKANRASRYTISDILHLPKGYILPSCICIVLCRICFYLCECRSQSCTCRYHLCLLHHRKVRFFTMLFVTLAHQCVNPCPLQSQNHGT